MRYSCPEQMIARDDLASRLRIIQDAGFDGIDVRYSTLLEPAHRELIAECGLPVASCYSQTRDPNFLDPGAADRSQAVADLVERAQAAIDIGAENLIVVPIFGGPRLELNTSEEDIRAIERGLFIAAAKEFGVATRDLPITIIVEPLNKLETHFLLDPLEGQEWADIVAEPTVASMVDTYHCWREQFDPAGKVQGMGDALRLMHFSDSERGLPGEGVVDFAAVVRALEARTYEGWNGFECRQIATDEDIAALNTSLNWVRSLEAQGGTHA